MKLAVIGRLGAGSILADENGNEVAFTVTEGSTANGGSFIDAPDMAKTIAHRVNCHDELVAALERITRIASVELGKTRPDVIEWARSALERAKQ